MRIKYHIRILPWMKHHAQDKGAQSSDWQRELFEDVTRGGTEIWVSQLPSNEHGPRITLHGTRFMCHAGIDKQRDIDWSETDCMFISKVEAELTPLAVTVQKITGPFNLLIDRTSPPEIGEPIIAVFRALKCKIDISALAPPAIDRKNSNRSIQDPEPSATLSAIIHAASTDLKNLWRPQFQDEPSAHHLLEDAIRIWLRYRLERYDPSNSPRRRMLMSGQVRPKQLSDEDLVHVREAVGVTMLNRMVSDTAGRAELPKLLRELADISVGHNTRATLYATTLGGLDGLTLRRELHEVSETLEALIDTSPSARLAWTKAMIEAIRRAADRLNDGALATLVDSITVADDPLSELAEWARRLRFASTAENSTEDDGHASEPNDTPLDPNSISEAADPDQRDQLSNPSLPEMSRLPGLQVGNTPLAEGIMVVAASSDLHPIGAADATHAESVVEQWALRLRIGSIENYEATAFHIKRNLATWLEEGLSSLTTFRSVCEFIRNTTILRDDLSSKLRELPDIDDLNLDLDDANRAYLAAAEAFGAHTASRLLDLVPEITPATLLGLAGELTSDTVLSLPGWLFHLEDLDEDSIERRLASLADPTLRATLSVVSAFIAGLSTDEREIALTVNRPIGQVEIGDYFVEAAQQALAAYRTISESPGTHRLWLATARREGIDHRRIAMTKDRLDRICDILGTTSTDEIWRRVNLFRDYNQLEAFLASAEGSVEACRATFPDLTVLPLDVILRAQRPMSTARESSGRRQHTLVRKTVTIDHNLVDTTAERVSPLWVAEDEDQKYGRVAVPLLLRAEEPIDLNANLDTSIRGKLREAWPSDRADIEPRTISIRSSQWRQDERGFIYTFVLSIPCRRPRDSRQTFAVHAQLFDHNDVEIGPKCKLEWRFGGIWADAIPFAWPDVMQPDLVRESPIGPQHKYLNMMEQLRGGGSVAVAIPRRFGKTTLVTYIHQTAATLELLIPAPVSCTTHQRRGKFDEQAFWDTVSRSLQAATGCGLRPPNLVAGLPAHDAFDDARRIAAGRGCRALVILVDEAHLLFPQTDEGELGHRMKDQLEHAWTRTGPDAMAPLAFCLIGLPSLLKRVGANFGATLWTYSDPSIREKELRALIIQKTGGKTGRKLSTTREVREELSRRASNLFILKTLLSRLVDHANQEQRDWVAYQDLERVQHNLVTDLKAGQEPQVALFIRDALNGAEDINSWHPIPAYAVAVAVAAMPGVLVFSHEKIIERLVMKLNEWCSQLSTNESYAKVVYTADQVATHLQTLRELKILTREAFSSPLVSAWLNGNSGSFPNDINERNALISGAVQRVRIPEGLEPVGKGSQAVIYRFVDAKEQYTVRKVVLATDEQRRRFLERAEALEVIRQRIDLRDEGSEFIFQLRAIGFADVDSGSPSTETVGGAEIGVEIYRWIDGEPLENRRKRLGGMVIADIGMKLAKALCILHVYGVLHRDITPSNVILADGGGRPTLIDFGFARLERQGFHTQLAGPFSAPEVCIPNPSWTTKADIYSLGSTLKASARDDIPHDVKLLLDRCMSIDPALRPQANEVAYEFESLGRALDLEVNKKSRWEKIVTAASTDRSVGWYWKVLEKFRHPFVMIGIGLHPSPIERCREVAGFLAQVLEGYPASSQGEKLSLGRVKNQNDQTGDRLATPAIELAHVLRLDRSHADMEKKVRSLMARHQILSNERLPTYMFDAAEQIGKVVGLSWLNATVRAILA